MSTELPRLLCDKCGLDLTDNLPPDEATEILSVTCGLNRLVPYHSIAHRPVVLAIE